MNFWYTFSFIIYLTCINYPAASYILQDVKHKLLHPHGYKFVGNSATTNSSGLLIVKLGFPSRQFYFDPRIRKHIYPELPEVKKILPAWYQIGQHSE